MSINQKKAVLIIAGLLIVVCTFFFYYQPNADTVTQLEQETNHFQSQINYLSSLQTQVNNMKQLAPAYQTAIKAFTDRFPSRMTQQKAIYNVYRLMSDTGIRISSISPGEEQTFLNYGTLGGADGGVQTDAAATGGGIEADMEAQLPINQMIGKYVTYQLSISGSRKQINKALDWISENKEVMSSSNISLTYDSSTGNLSGTIEVTFYALNGNGVPYIEPDITGITIGSDNVFGTVK